MNTSTHILFDEYLFSFVSENYNNPMHYYYFDTLFSDTEISNILESFSNLCQNKGTTFDSSQKEFRKTNITWIPRNDSTIWIYDRMVGALVNANKAMFNYDITSLRDQIQLGCYEAKDNGKYHRHVDINDNDIHCCRKLSISVLLSDPNSYEGGDLLIRNYTAPRKKGSACVFSSFVEHEVTTVTKGKRYSLVLWIYGPPFR